MNADDLEEELEKAMAEAEAAIERTGEAIENRSPNRFKEQTKLTVELTPDDETMEQAQKTVQEMIQIVRDEERATWADERKRLELAVTEAKSQADFANDKLLRSMAEFENYKRRALKETDQRIQDALGRLLGDFLPLGDNLSRAKGIVSGDPSMLAGLTMLEQSFFSALAKHEIVPVPALGCSFNPEVHEAIAQKITDKDVGVIVEEFEKGYTWRDRLLRPARVVVSMGKGEEG